MKIDTCHVALCHTKSSELKSVNIRGLFYQFVTNICLVLVLRM